MGKKLTLINYGLVLVILLLGAAAAKVWLTPKYPQRIDRRTAEGLTRPLGSVVIGRQETDPASIDRVLASNVFRKERAEYVPPPPPPSAAPAQAPGPAPAPSLPPPSVALKGTFMSNGTKVAFLEGKYPVMDAGNKITEKPIKRKGYALGDTVGTYKVSTIEKYRITLANAQGGKMTLQMPKSPPEKLIKRQGTHFSHKDKNARSKNRQVDVEKIKPVAMQRTQTPQRARPVPVPQPRRQGTPPKVPNRTIQGRTPTPAPPPRQAPARTAPPPAQMGISGSATPTPPPATRRPPHISGAFTGN